MDFCYFYLDRSKFRKRQQSNTSRSNIIVEALADHGWLKGKPL
jgi:hypothetical protein